MSDSTLYSSLYQQISTYAEQVDAVLIAIVTQRHDTGLYRQLAKMLHEIIEPAEGQLVNRMIAEMLTNEGSLGESDIQMAAEALETNHVDEVTRDIIERLANSLEQERTKAMARIRGARR